MTEDAELLTDLIKEYSTRMSNALQELSNSMFANQLRAILFPYEKPQTSFISIDSKYCLVGESNGLVMLMDKDQHIVLFTIGLNLSSNSEGLSNAEITRNLYKLTFAYMSYAIN